MLILGQAIDLKEARFDTIIPETLQLSFFGQSQDLYADMVKWSRPLDSVSAFNYVERGRSRAFLELMGDTAVPQPASLHLLTDLGHKESQLRQQLRDLRLEIARELTLEANITKLWQQYADVDKEVKKTLEALDKNQKDVAAYIDLRQGRPLSWTAVQKLLIE